jgi:hypothetical protein
MISEKMKFLLFLWVILIAEESKIACTVCQVFDKTAEKEKGDTQGASPFSMYIYEPEIPQGVFIRWSVCFSAATAGTAGSGTASAAAANWIG